MKNWQSSKQCRDYQRCQYLWKYNNCRFYHPEWHYDWVRMQKNKKFRPQLNQKKPHDNKSSDSYPLDGPSRSTYQDKGHQQQYSNNPRYNHGGLNTHQRGYRNYNYPNTNYNNQKYNQQYRNQNSSQKRAQNDLNNGPNQSMSRNDEKYHYNQRQKNNFSYSQKHYYQKNYSRQSNYQNQNGKFDFRKKEHHFFQRENYAQKHLKLNNPPNQQFKNNLLPINCPFQPASSFEGNNITRGDSNIFQRDNNTFQRGDSNYINKIFQITPTSSQQSFINLFGLSSTKTGINAQQFIEQKKKVFEVKQPENKIVTKTLSSQSSVISHPYAKIQLPEREIAFDENQQIIEWGQSCGEDDFQNDDDYDREDSFIASEQELQLVSQASLKRQKKDFSSCSWFFKKTPALKFSDMTQKQKQRSQQCSICLMSLRNIIVYDSKTNMRVNQPNDNKKNLKRLYCSHIFHHVCINIWLTDNPQCPNCRIDYRRHQQFAQFDRRYEERIQKQDRKTSNNPIQLSSSQSSDSISHLTPLQQVRAIIWRTNAFRRRY